MCGRSMDDFTNYENLILVVCAGIKNVIGEAFSSVEEELFLALGLPARERRYCRVLLWFASRAPCVDLFFRMQDSKGLR